MKADRGYAVGFVSLLLVVFSACVRMTGGEEIRFDGERTILALGVHDIDGNGRDELIVVLSSRRKDELGLDRMDSTFVYLFERSGKKGRERFHYLWQSGPLGRAGPDGTLDGLLLTRVFGVPDTNRRRVLISGPDGQFEVFLHKDHYRIGPSFERDDADGGADSDLAGYLGFEPESLSWYSRGTKDYLFLVHRGRVEVLRADPAGRKAFVRKGGIVLPGARLIAVGRGSVSSEGLLFTACADGKILVHKVSGL